MEILIYGPIFNEKTDETDVTPADVLKAIASAKPDEPITVRINSPGGNAFAGFAIYNALKEISDRVTVRIEGLAASAASFVAMAGSRIECSKPSMLMIHQASGFCIGTADDMQKMADDFRKFDQTIAEVYAARSGAPVETWAAAMKAETWYTADEAVAAKLADGIFGEGELTTKNSAASVRAVKNLWRRDFMPRVAAMARNKVLGSSEMATGKCTLPGGETQDNCDQAFCEAAGGTFEETPPAEPPPADGTDGSANAATSTAAEAVNSVAPATLAEIEAAAPCSPAEFILNCQRKAMTIAQVTSANTKRLNDENAALRKKLAAKPTAQATAKSTVIGTVSAAATSDSGEPDALRARWDSEPDLRAEFATFDKFKAWNKYKDRITVNGQPVTEFR